MRTVLCDLLGCRHPIVQSPMTWVSDTTLTAAASEAGAFGILASTIAPAGEVEAYIGRIQEITNQPFGVYATGIQPNLAEVVAAVLRRGVRGFSYGRGVDRETIAKLKAAGVVCMTTVGAPKHAAKAVALGADVIMVQGSEGGGHTGTTATTVLLPQVLDTVPVPVVASGGFFDGRGLAAALSYGAAGIAMGTRFLMTRESRVSPVALAHYCRVTDAGSIRISTAIDGLPQRMIANRLITDLEEMSWLRQMRLALSGAWRWKSEGRISNAQFLVLALRSMREGPAAAVQTLRMSRLPELLRLGLFGGDVENGLLPSGQVAAAIGELMSCEDLVAQIIEVAERRLIQLSAEISA